ncbi:MAG TPA: chemotaxis protein CheW [Myxococcales bacterium]
MSESESAGARARAIPLGDLTPDLLEVLQTRAARARATEEEGGEQAEAMLPVAEFPVGSDTYAIPLASLRAVVPLRMVAPLPLAPPHVLGFLRFQNQLVSAMSLMALLGVRGWRQDCAVLLVVDMGEGHLVAVDCEQVPRIGALPLSHVEQARSGSDSPVLDIAAGGGTVRQVGLVDVGALLERARRGGGGSGGGRAGGGEHV